MDEFFVTGLARNREFGALCIHFKQTENGWTQRPISPSNALAMDCLRADYVCNETQRDLMDWIECDFESKKINKSPPSVDWE